MTTTYKNLLDRLKREIEIEGARAFAIDALAKELLKTGDERLAEDLLALLSDESQNDEGMFSLLHAAESFSDITYVHSLLSVAPRLLKSAPRWSSIVFMRALNNLATQRELVKQLQQAPEPVKQSVREVCKRIDAISPRFSSKTIPVILATL